VEQGGEKKSPPFQVKGERKPKDKPHYWLFIWLGGLHYIFFTFILLTASFNKIQ